jgi:YfiH family protein
MINFLTPDWPAPPHIHALTTLRIGGCSVGNYASLNLGDHVGDDPVCIEENRQKLYETLKFQHKPFWLNQVHGIKVIDWNGSPQNNEADAAFTRLKQYPCVVLTADCLPILLCDREGTIVAAVHAGWKGLLSGVIETTVAAMQVPGEKLLAWMGPAIGPAAFEVGEEVREQFITVDEQAQSAFRHKGGQKWLADIFSLGRQRLRRVGVTAVYGGNECTYSDAERFFSFRRDKDTGRLATLIWMT